MHKDGIILATHNQGKINELKAILMPLGISVTGLDTWPELQDIQETGETFKENALIKAQTVARATGKLAIADDSGLIVDALHGKPGVHSARYADDWTALPGESRDSRNIRKLLFEMRDIKTPDRKAHFETAMAAVTPAGKSLVTIGRWHGEILYNPRGANGFGYDPVFFDPSLGKSGAELERSEKNAVSHRAKALDALLNRWQELLTS